MVLFFLEKNVAVINSIRVVFWADQASTQAVYIQGCEVRIRLGPPWRDKHSDVLIEAARARRSERTRRLLALARELIENPSARSDR